MGLYCKICIARELAGQKAVSRYKICIVTEAAGLAGRWAGRRRSARGAQAERTRGVGGAHEGRRRDAWGEQVGRAGRWAQACGLCAPGRAARPASCALGAPSLFFDSVLFLSHRLDMVREHCS